MNDIMVVSVTSLIGCQPFSYNSMSIFEYDASKASSVEDILEYCHASKEIINVTVTQNTQITLD